MDHYKGNIGRTRFCATCGGTGREADGKALCEPCGGTGRARTSKIAVVRRASLTAELMKNIIREFHPEASEEAISTVALKLMVVVADRINMDLISEDKPNG